MMKVALVFLIAAWMSAGDVFAQAAPPPEAWFKFNQSLYPLSGPVGLLNNSQAYVDDRFGNRYRALYIMPGRYVAYSQPIFGLARIPREVTISFWIKLEDLLGYKKILSGNTSYGNGEDRFGIVLRGDSLALRRDKGQAPAPWDFRLLESEWKLHSGGSGWYFVTLIYKEFVSRVFVGRFGQPDLNCSYNFLGSWTQHWEDVLFWIIGDFRGEGASRFAIDDLKIWGSALSIDQVQQLFNNSGSNGNAGRIASEETPDKSIDAALKVYPNPAGDEIKVAFYKQEAGGLNLQIRDATGRLLYDERLQNIEAGAHVHTISGLKGRGIARGFYLLNVYSSEYRQTVKVIVQ